MYLPSLFVLLVYISGYLTLLFSALCLACGLMYCVELAEEHTVLTRKIIRITILIQLILHPFLYIYEHLPFLPTTLSFISHISYHTLLQSFPFITLSSPNTILSIILFLLSNVLYYRFFTSAQNTYIFYNYNLSPLPSLVAFLFITVWLVPLMFFVSLNVNDAVLPGAGVDEPMMSSGKKRRKMNVVMAVVEAVKRLWGGERRDHGVGLEF